MKFARVVVLGGMLATLQVLASGCQTLADQPAISIPKPYQSYFGVCAPSDGASTIQAYKDGALQGSAELEWIARPGSDWQARVTDPVGRSLLELRLLGGKVQASGTLAAHLPRMTVNKRGFLEAEGTLLALTGEELPCILAGRIPRSWMALARERELKRDGSSRLILADSVRVISIDFAKNAASADAEVCSHIRWGRFFGFMRHELTWCQKGPRRQQTRLESDLGFGLRMVKIDEGPAT